MLKIEQLQSNYSAVILFLSSKHQTMDVFMLLSSQGISIEVTDDTILHVCLKVFFLITTFLFKKDTLNWLKVLKMLTFFLYFFLYFK